MPRIKSKRIKKDEAILAKAKKLWRTGICQDCGVELPIEKLYKGKDPYVSEIRGEAEAEDVCICNKCYKERAWDV